MMLPTMRQEMMYTFMLRMRIANSQCTDEVREGFESKVPRAVHLLRNTQFGTDAG
jgi:hypothetical protein